MADGYVRTRIKRLKVSGYRSLYDVELTDLPEIVVFHGKNGTGKSNLMGVPGMVLRWVTEVGFLEENGQQVFPYRDAHRVLGLRKSDFNRGRGQMIHVELEIEIGTAASSAISPDGPDPLGLLQLSLSLIDLGDGIGFAYDKATIDSQPLVRGPGGKRHHLDRQIHQACQSQLLLLHYPAYRSIGHGPATTADKSLASTFQTRMFEVHVDPDLSRRRQLTRLGHRLGDLGAFPGGEFIELSPVLDNEFNEHRLLIAVPGVGDIPLENLGTGQQQLIMMAADALVEHRPIVQIEEPEAHLHKDLMETFARFLRTEAEMASPESPIDQVWISTHHHAFAIAPEYFEVTHDPDKGTMVERRDRAYATRHFYEPGPLWEALRSLANSTSRETIVMHDGRGQSITAGEILDSIEGDRERANEFAEAATRTVVSRFRKRPVEAS